MPSSLLRHRVRYHETDAQHFVFNSRYLEWADTAMVEFFRGLGWTYTELNQSGFDPSLATTTMNFKQPARFDDFIDVDVTCTRVGRSSFEVQFVMRREDEILTEITTTYVNVDVATARSAPIPEPIAQRLRTSSDVTPC